MSSDKPFLNYRLPDPYLGKYIIHDEASRVTPEQIESLKQLLADKKLGNAFLITSSNRKRGSIMARGEFTKQEAQKSIQTLKDMFEEIPKTKKANYIGHLIDLALFLKAAKRVAPDEDAK